jgi:hypothetical protein
VLVVFSTFAREDQTTIIAHSAAHDCAAVLRSGFGAHRARLSLSAATATTIGALLLRTTEQAFGALKASTDRAGARRRFVV